MRPADSEKTGMFPRIFTQPRLAALSRQGRIAGRVAATLIMVVAASVAAGSAGAAAARHPADTTTVTWHGPELPPLHSVYLIRMQCPSNFPYLLNQHFNPGSGFRLNPGIQFTDYRSGFDAVALSSIRIPFTRDGVSGHMKVGISGDRDFILNSATNWAWFTSTRFTLIMHCTSDASKGAFERPHDSR